jgi:hypothetical protein
MRVSELPEELTLNFSSPDQIEEVRPVLESFLGATKAAAVVKNVLWLLKSHTPVRLVS